MNLLEQPTKKLFVSDLKKSNISTRMLWIQGVVVQSTPDEIVLDDGTGVVRVVGCDKIPAPCAKVKTGQYVMVIGVLMSAGGVVRAVKIQDLSGCTVAETMWMLEVIDSAGV